MGLFGWRMLLRKLPTRDNLFYRGINIQTLCYPLCKMRMNELHFVFLVVLPLDLFGSRDWVIGWGCIMTWSWMVLEHFEWYGSIVTEKNKKVKFIVWLATMWAIWLEINSCVFQDILPKHVSVINTVNILLWGGSSVKWVGSIVIFL